MTDEPETQPAILAPAGAKWEANISRHQALLSLLKRSIYTI